MTWFVTLNGHDFDLQDISILFSPSSSPECYIAKKTDGYYLYSQAFDDLKDATKILSRAIDLLATMNGLAKLVSDSFQPVQPTHVVEIAENGTRQIYVTESATVRMRGDLSIKVFRANGTVEEAQSSNFDTPKTREWIGRLNSNSFVDRALFLYGSLEHTWKNLYMVLEVIEDAVGGENNLTGKKWGRKKQVKLFKQTANSFNSLGRDARHGATSQPPPPKPMSLSEARGLIRQLLQDWLDEMKL